MTEQGVLRLGAPESVPQLAWMVGLIPVAFVTLAMTFIGYSAACVDGCAQAPAAVVIAGGAWAVGAGAWLTTLIVSATRVSLGVATVGLTAPVVVGFVATFA